MCPAASPTILVVEDDTSVRLFLNTVLRDAGYTIIEANGGIAAEEVLRTYAGEIQLVILDMVMPRGNGLDFANRLSIERPSTEVLYISGFVDSVAVSSIVQRKPEAMLKKPFTSGELLQRVKGLLAA